MRSQMALREDTPQLRHIETNAAISQQLPRNPASRTLKMNISIISQIFHVHVHAWSRDNSGRPTNVIQEKPIVPELIVLVRREKTIPRAEST